MTFVGEVHTALEVVPGLVTLLGDRYVVEVHGHQVTIPVADVVRVELHEAPLTEVA